jgi:hypothetical protein
MRGPARRRLALKPQTKLEARDDFKFADWNSKSYVPWETAAKAATGGEGAAALKTPSSEAEQRMREEATRQINARVRNVSTKAPPADTAARTRELDVVQHWIDHGETYGRLRDFFGTAYVKVVKAYDGIRSKIETKVADAKRRMGRATGGAGGIKGAVLAAIRAIAGSLLGLLVRDVASKLMTAFQKGGTALLGTLFGEEADQIEEQLAAIEQKRKEFESFIRQAIEDKFQAQLETLESKIREIESVAATMSDVGTLVNIVKWAYRIAQCLAPPALGCLIALIGSSIAEGVLAAIVGSCWFKREVAYPLIEALGPVRALPTVVATTIADRVRQLLPDSLKPLVGEVDTADLVSTPGDVDCDSTSSYNKMDANQRKLAEMLKQYDPDHVDSMLKALEHLGVAKNPPGPDDKLEGAEIDALKALLDKYSKTEFEEYVAKTPPQQPKDGKSGEFLTDLDQAVQKQGGGQKPGPTPPAGGAAQGGAGGGAPPTAEEVAKEGADIAKRLKKAKTKPGRGERQFFIHKDKAGNMLRPDGKPVAKGDRLKTLLVVHLDSGTIIGGLQTLTVTEVGTDGLTVTVHSGTRFYTIDGTYADTSTEESSVVFKKVRK